MHTYAYNRTQMQFLSFLCWRLMELNVHTETKTYSCGGVGGSKRVAVGGGGQGGKIFWDGVAKKFLEAVATKAF